MRQTRKKINVRKTKKGGTVSNRLRGMRNSVSRTVRRPPVNAHISEPSYMNQPSRTRYNPRGYVHNVTSIPVQAAYPTQPAIGIPTNHEYTNSAMGVPIPTFNGAYGPITLPERSDGHGWADRPVVRWAGYQDEDELNRFRRNYTNTEDDPIHLRGVPPLAHAAPRRWWQREFNGKNYVEPNYSQSLHLQ